MKLLNVASEAVILELVKSKCIPILLNGLECCQLSNTDLQSLDFTFIRLSVKLFRTNSIDVAKVYQYFSGFEMSNCLIKNKFDKFIPISLVQWQSCGQSCGWDGIGSIYGGKDLWKRCVFSLEWKRVE